MSPKPEIQENKETKENAEKVARRIRRMEIKADRLVRNLLGGQYLSVFKGRGIEFTEVREYQEGDDVRLIDWNVTARMDRLFVKKFVEERELTLILVVDLSASQGFGSSSQLKREQAAEFAAAIALSAMHNHDQVGLLLFSDRIEKFIPPKRGRPHALRVIRDILVSTPEGTKTDYSLACKHLMQMLKRRSTVFFLSDFIDPQFESHFKALSLKHDLIAVTLTDPREQSLPDIGLVCLEDPETRNRCVVDTSDPEVRRHYEEHSLALSQNRTRAFRGLSIDELVLVTGQSYVAPLLRFFQNREQRRLRRHR